MTVEVTGMRDALARLDRAKAGVEGNGLSRLVALATGETHRYLLSLSAAGTPPTTPGVLPVVTGRLKNSFFTQTRGAVGLVGSNIAYGPAVEARRGFLSRTVRDMERPINNLVAAHVTRVTR